MSRIGSAAASVAALLCLGTIGGAPTPAQAQGFGISGEIGFGARVRQEYFGAEDYAISPRGRGSLEAIRFGPVSRGEPGVVRDTEGFGFRGAFRLVPGRSASDFPELTGLEDVSFSVELGLGVAYELENARVFADVRYGVIGHGTWVSEIGGDVIYRPSDRLTISAGPRAFFGSEDYASTYFGVTAAEAGASAFNAFDASGGLLSAGFEVLVDQRLNDDWSIQGELEFSRFLNDASASPITQEADHAIFSLTLSRRFSFGF
ncbi:MipA/OmpV family protein [Gymnodinialimonas sp.]